MFKRLLSFRNIRRIYALFFLFLFFTFLILTDFRNLKGYNVTFFLEINPLVSLSTFLTGKTVFRGLILSLVIIIPTLFLGRFFCSWVCPMGTLNQILSSLFLERRKSESLTLNAYKVIFSLKYYLLIILLVLSLQGILQIGLLDPISLLTRSFSVSIIPALHLGGLPVYLFNPLFHGGLLISFIFLTLIFVNRYMTKLWCRMLCPLGALLGLLSIAAPFRIQRDIRKCTDCNECVKKCHGGCDPNEYLRITECHLCLNCVEVCPEKALHFGLPTTESAFHAPIDVSRRRAVEVLAASFMLGPFFKTSLAGSGKAVASVIRPPGSLPEEKFTGRCIKCSECIRVCPTGVLQPALLESGFEGLWTPLSINKIGYCEFNCVLCGQVCPTGAIKSLTVQEKTGHPPFKKPVKIGTAFFDRGRCLPWAMNKECIVCEEVCPTSPKAIWFKQEKITLRDGATKTLKKPYLEPELCVGCGVCENKCPVKGLPAIRVSSVGESRSEKNRMILG